MYHDQQDTGRLKSELGVSEVLKTLLRTGLVTLFAFTFGLVFPGLSAWWNWHVLHRRSGRATAEGRNDPPSDLPEIQETTRGGLRL